MMPTSVYERMLNSKDNTQDLNKYSTTTKYQHVSLFSEKMLG